MSDSRGDPRLDRLLGELLGSLRRLERELQPRTGSGLLRPPTPRELARFTSEVGVPAAILVLRINVEALRLLQRTLRMANGNTADRRTDPGELADRTRRVTRVSLDRLDDALAELQTAIEGRPPGDEASELVARTRDLRDELDARLASAGEADTERGVGVDVEAELDSIRRAVDAEESGSDADEDGTDT